MVDSQDGYLTYQRKKKMNKTSYSDRVRSLQYQSEINERMALLHEPYMKPLTEFVEELRRKKGSQFYIPYFDPCDGGVNARLLIVAEAPGPKVKNSGFVSRNNHDDTAENTNRVLHKAGLKREDTLLWNIVPWYIGSDARIREPRKKELIEGMDYILQLCGLLHNLKAIVLLGANAREAFNAKAPELNVKIFDAPHPSAQNLNLDKDAERVIITRLSEANEYLRSVNSGDAR